LSEWKGRYNFPVPLRPQTLTEEIANTLIHLVGFGLGIAVLVIRASALGDPWRIVSFAIYGSCLVFLYGASALYHVLPRGPVKQVVRKIDHAAIFLLIAGTYTPFMLVPLRGGWGWSLFGVVWGVSMLGIGILDVLRRKTALQVALYVLLGWVALVAIVPIVLTIPFRAIALLVAGGLSYTLGVLFFAWERLPFHHAVWHAFVLGGSVCHFIALLTAT
jgi:hemolysin III